MMHHSRKFEEGVPLSPQMVIFYITYACNHRCPGCDYGSEIEQFSNHMPIENVFKLLREFHGFGITSLEFCGGGEPTFHPNFLDACEYWFTLQGRFGLITNGKKLGEKEMCNKLLNWSEYIRISLVPARKGGFVLDKKIVRDLVWQRGERVKPEIGLKLLLTRQSIGDIKLAFEYAVQTNVDNLQFKFVRNDQQVEVDQNLEKSVVMDIEKLMNRYPRLKVSVPPVNESRPRMIVGKPCLSSSVQLVVDPFGNAFLCCYYRHRSESHKLGNVLDQGMTQIWGSEKHFRVARSVKHNECNVYDCRFSRYNSLLESGVANVVKHNSMGPIFF